MEFRILGPLEVCDGEGNAAELGGRQQRLVLGMLLLHRNEVVSVDRLIDVVWEERAPPSAPKNIQIHVSRLRKAIEAASRSGRGESAKTVVRTRPNGYVLEVAPGEVDVDRFQRLVEEGRRALAAGEFAGAAATLREALALWRGEPLADFAYDSFAQSEIRRLDELRLGALEERIEADLELGREDDVTAELQALVTRHPTRERLRGHLMLALYRSGRKAEGLRVYDEARRTLAEELGLEPSESLQRLHRAVLTDDPGLAAPARAPKREILDQDASLAASAAALQARSLARLRRVGVVAALILAASAVLGAFLATRDSPGGLTSVGPNYVGMIDPKTNDILAAIPVGIRPGPVAAGARALWVGNVSDRSLTKVDPRRRSVVASFSLDGRTPTGLAVGAGAVWVAHGRRGELSRVEPQFGQRTRTIRLAVRPHGSPTGSVAVGAGFVWAAFGDSTLARIEPKTVRPSGSTLTGGSPTAVVVNGGAVWVASSGDATIQRFNPTTFEEGPIRSISVGRRPTAMAYGEGALWVANENDDSVTRVEPSTNSTTTIRVGDEPVAIAVGTGAVWVANSGDGTVTRIDPRTNEVVGRLEIGNAPAGIIAADGFIWVTVQAP
jgi:DNA-binding SARP family transcriptional activator/DNA-binding beta-propeller fold protein YncE